MAGHEQSGRLLEYVEDNFLIQLTDKWSKEYVLQHVKECELEWMWTWMNLSGFGYCSHENEKFKIQTEENWTNCRRKNPELVSRFCLVKRSDLTVGSPGGQRGPGKVVNLQGQATQFLFFLSFYSWGLYKGFPGAWLEPVSRVCESEATPIIEEVNMREHLRKWDETGCIQEEESCLLSLRGSTHIWKVMTVRGDS